MDNISSGNEDRKLSDCRYRYRSIHCVHDVAYYYTDMEQVGVYPNFDHGRPERKLETPTSQGDMSYRYN